MKSLATFSNFLFPKKKKIKNSSVLKGPISTNDGI
jgi:hypothetical protein